MKRFLVFSLFALGLTTQAQRPGWLGLSPKNEPTEDIQNALYRYYIRSAEGYSTRPFRLDTVPTAEIKERFYRTVNTDLKLQPYAGLDSVEVPFGTGILLGKSPLASCPVKGVDELRGVWSYGGALQLNRLLRPDGTADDAALQKLRKRYDVEDGIGVTPRWLSGTVTLLRHPRAYMDFVVSPCPVLMRYVEGEMVDKVSLGDGWPDFFSMFSPSGMLDGDWTTGLQQGMYTFATFLNLSLLPRGGKAKFTFLLTIRPDLRCDAELLLPREPSSAEQAAFQRLRDYIRRLHPGLFKPLYTSDGRVFPARYLEAWYGPTGWQIADLLGTSPRIPEGEYRLQPIR